MYILPCYIENLGDGCKVKDEKGERVVDIKITSLLKSILKERMLDFREIKRKSKRILNQRNIIPLYIGDGEILLPIKVRKPKVLRDEVYGYVNFYFIDKIEDGQIILKDGQVINYLESKRALSRRLKMVSLLEREFCDKIKSNYFNLNDPATKGDIMFLLKEIIDIKRLLDR